MRQGVKREMSLSDLHILVRGNLWGRLDNLVSWPIRNISSTIQWLGGATEADSVVRILNDVLARRKDKISTSSTQWEK